MTVTETLKARKSQLDRKLVSYKLDSRTIDLLEVQSKARGVTKTTLVETAVWQLLQPGGIEL